MRDIIPLRAFVPLREITNPLLTLRTPRLCETSILLSAFMPLLEKLLREIISYLLSSSKTANMKKIIIGALVGGLIIFIWQTLSWAMLNLHHSNQEYTPKQDSILSYLSSQFSEDGSYLMPNYPRTETREEMEKQMSANQGKPWAEIQYHKSLNVNMGSNIGRGLIVDIIIVALACWIFLQLPSSFGTILIASLFSGVIVFLNSPYTVHIWYPKADIMQHFWDAVISWGLCGIWLGWWLKKK